LATVRDSDKREFISIARKFTELGFELLTTSGTMNALLAAGIETTLIRRIGEENPNILDAIRSGEVGLVINTPTRGRAHNRDGYKIRRNAVEHGIPCLTSLDTANALLMSLEHAKRDRLTFYDISKL
jgi:carbamoyl-phosphate synthase large subunit